MGMTFGKLIKLRRDTNTVSSYETKENIKLMERDMISEEKSSRLQSELNDCDPTAFQGHADSRYNFALSIISNSTTSESTLREGSVNKMNVDHNYENSEYVKNSINNERNSTVNIVQPGMEPRRQ